MSHLILCVASLLIAQVQSGSTIRVYPDQVNLDTPFSAQRVLVVREVAGAAIEDITSRCSLIFESPAIAKAEAGNILRPLADGTTNKSTLARIAGSYKVTTKLELDAQTEFALGGEDASVDFPARHRFGVTVGVTRELLCVRRHAVERPGLVVGTGLACPHAGGQFEHSYRRQSTQAGLVDRQRRLPCAARFATDSQKRD